MWQFRWVSILHGILFKERRIELHQHINALKTKLKQLITAFDDGVITGQPLVKGTAKPKASSPQAARE